MAIPISNKVISPDDFHLSLHTAVGTPKQRYKSIRRGKRILRVPVDSHHLAKWCEAYVNIKARTVNIKVYVDLFQDEDLQDAEYSRLLQLALQGISQYWSGNIQLLEQTFRVQTNAIPRSGNAVSARIMKATAGGALTRSFNLGAGMANFIYRERPNTQTTSAADVEFRLVCAHEFGHSVLSSFGGIKHSWSHKGSTHIIPQSVKSSTPGYPASGPIDLMKYYDARKNLLGLTDMSKRSRATSKDILKLIWLCTINF